jgi:hypothetical protein
MLEVIRGVEKVLDKAEQAMEGKRPWRGFAAAIGDGISIGRLRERFESRASYVRGEIDRIFQTTENKDKFLKDDSFQLETARMDQQKRADKMIKQWNRIATFKYKKRNDRWRYKKKKKSSKFGSFVTIHSGYKTAEVFFKFIPDIVNETQTLEYLMTMMERMTSQELSVATVLNDRRRLVDAKQKYLEYNGSGPRQEMDTPARFKQRNDLIMEMFQLAFEASHRQEAQAKQDYVGVRFSHDLQDRYSNELVRFREMAKKVGKARVIAAGFGVTLGAGACAVLLYLSAM